MSSYKSPLGCSYSPSLQVGHLGYYDTDNNGDRKIKTQKKIRTLIGSENEEKWRKMGEKGGEYENEGYARALRIDFEAMTYDYLLNFDNNNDA